MTEIKSDKNPKDNKPNKLKRKGLIRSEAVIPFLIVVAVFFVYFELFFDHNLRSAFEWIGYEVVGAEVDIATVETSFLHGTFRMQGIEVTNPGKPDFNMIQIGDIRFGVLWDGLLRARVVVDEMAVEKIEISVPRKKTGKVKPPPPPPKPGESALEKGAKQLGNQALDVTKEQYKDNVLGDVAALLGGTSGEEQSKNIEENLPSKKKLDAFSKDLAEKQKKWNEKLASLPQSKEIEALGKKLSAVKTGNFSGPQEMVESLQKIAAILQEANTKYSAVASIGNELKTDIDNANAQFKEIDAQVKKDTADLEARFHIPKIDGKSLSNNLLQKYLAPYLAKINQYRPLVEKVAPPNLMKKGSTDEAEIDLQPRQRSKGVSYEFGRLHSYPMFWIKKISVSSKAGASANAGDISGLITDITSNQVLTGKPTVAQFQGSFPNLQVDGILVNIKIDDRKATSLVDFDFSVNSYAIDGKDFINSPEAQVSFKKALGSIKSHGELSGLTNLDMNFGSQISKIDYSITAQNSTIDEILKGVFLGIPVITIDAKGTGQLPNINLDVNSNFGPELQKGLEKQVNKKIEDAKAKLTAEINKAIGNERAQVEAQLNQAKSQVDGQVKKTEDQLNAQKSKADKESDQSKKGATQKPLNDDTQKKLDDLKKQLGF